MQKPFYKSKTIWGIVLTVASACAVPAWEAYRESKDIEDVISAVLPVLITTIPGSAIAVDGRMKANKKLTIK